VAFTSLVHWGRSLRQNKLAGTLRSLASLAAPRHRASGAVGDDGAMGMWEHMYRCLCLQRLLLFDIHTDEGSKQALGLRLPA